MAFVRGLDRQVTGRATEEARIRALCDEYDIAQRTLVARLQSVSRDADRSAREFSEVRELPYNTCACTLDSRLRFCK